MDDRLPLQTAEELFEEAPCGYLSLLPDGTIVRINRTFLEWTGYAREDLLDGRRFQDLLTIGGKIFHETHYAPLLRMQGFVHEIAFDLVRRDGSHLPVLVNTVEKRDGTGHPHIHWTTVFNATDRRRYERELLDARKRAERAFEELRQLNETLEDRVSQEVHERLKVEDALRQAQKMEALGQLTGGVAHDFNNLLTVVMGGLEAIGRHLPALPVSSEAVRIERAREMAMQGVQRAAALTHRLLAFSRRQPLDPKPLDVNKMVAGMSELLRRTLGETVALETSLERGLWLTLADANQLENALLNLAVNARDAMPAGGKLIIETANAHLDESYVAVLAEPVPVGQYVMVAVTDTGTGMDAATLEHVFEPFFTTKEVGKGTGLGLSQVYGFVRQSGGHVRIYSELGEGTSVKIYLPRLQGQVAQTSNREQSQEAPAPPGGETLLVVEDDDDLRTFSAEILSELGYRVLLAENGQEALDLLDREPTIQLLFTDLVLPGGMNGRQVADEALRRRPDLQILFATGYARDAVVHHGRLNSGVQVLAKPFTYTDLANKVRRLLDGR